MPPVRPVGCIVVAAFVIYAIAMENLGMIDKTGLNRLILIDFYWPEM